MNAAADFETRRFQTAAAHYLAGRAPYPPALIARAAELVGLGPEHRLLDLGCGPAQIALAFAPLVGEVMALDPEPAMLAIAREAARDVRNVVVAKGSSDGLGPALGRFRAVTIGRAFHWMDGPETLRRLDRLVEPGGAVALFADERPPIDENGWVREYRDLIGAYSADDETHPRRRERTHLTTLLDSPFSRLERITVYTRRPATADSLIDQALSLSSTSRARLGDRADEMIAEIRRRHANWAAAGPLTEVVGAYALIARRP
ncbi:MAG: methyltransferase domain-containing protein [Caulobacteraceae bacterium]